MALQLPFGRVAAAFSVLFLAACGTTAASNGTADTDAAEPDVAVEDVAATDVAPGTDAIAADTSDVAPDVPEVAEDIAPDVTADVASDVTVTVCTCGDGNCNGDACGESLASCPADCAGCGNGKCEPGEGPLSCPIDCCGSCGDGKCVGYSCGEDPQKCPEDCGKACGNGVCEKSESPSTCAEDCKHQVCGNNVCEPEDGGPKLCPEDCGTSCGNCVCEKGEDFLSCPLDCGFCGDGVCSTCSGLGESAQTCTTDCQANCFAKGCDDAITCTTDVCGSDGQCAHVPDSASCGDANPCTDDACVPTKGCVNGANTAACNDGDNCTLSDACSEATCAGVAADCDDSNPCTADTCAPSSGACKHAPVVGPCDDGDFCTIGDGCGGGKCLPGAVTDCNDDDDCTADKCDTFSGCKYTPVACKACVPGDPCVPADVCHLGMTTCIGKASQCTDTTAPAADDLPCGLNKGCVAGVCKSYANKISVFSGGGQNGSVNGQLLPVVIKVVDSGGAPVSGAKVSIVPTEGAAAIPASGTSTSQGKFTSSPRLGRSVGVQEFVVNATNAASITFQATAIMPQNNTIFSILNGDHSMGNDGLPGPATLAHVGQVGDISAASDGTIYVAEPGNHRVIRISKAGAASVVAGNGSAGASGNGGPAIAAALNAPLGVAIDEATNLLYIADSGNNVIRVVDLADGSIGSFAGGGTAPGPGFGDSNVAAAAQFLAPTHVRIGPDHGLYVGDSGHNRVRRIDLDTQAVSAFVGNAAGVDCTQPVALSECGPYGGPAYSNLGCDIAWNAAGDAFVTGKVCGTGPGYATSGIIRRDKNGALSHVAGQAYGAALDGGPANLTAFGGIGGIAVDKVGNIFVTEFDKAQVRKIEHASGRVVTVMGTGIAGFAGDDGPVNLAQVGQPYGLWLDGGQNLFVTDSQNADVREVVTFGQTVATPAKLSLVSGSNLSGLVDQAMTEPFVVKLTDANDQPLAGFTLHFNVVSSGAGLYDTAASTGSDGTASTTGRVGLAPGPYGVQATFRDLDGKDVAGSPLDLAMTAIAPDVGSIFTAINADHSQGLAGIPGPGSLAHTDTLMDTVFGSDGTQYIADAGNHRVYALSPSGALSVVAGSSSAGGQNSGYSGDGGPAVKAQFHAPAGVAFLPAAGKANDTLFVTDSFNNVIRGVDLKTGVVSAFGGGGASATGPGWGDGGPASAAVLSYPTHIYKGPDNALYVADGSHNRIRRVNLATGIIEAWMGSANGAACGSSDPDLFDCDAGGSLGLTTGCAATWDSSGNAYVVGRFCSTEIGTATTAIVKRAPNGALTWLGGKSDGTDDEGIDAKATVFGSITSIALDANGNILVSEYSKNRIRQIDPLGKVTTVAGTATAGAAGDYVALALAQFNGPWEIKMAPNGHMTVTDTLNFTLRYVW